MKCRKCGKSFPSEYYFCSPGVCRSCFPQLSPEEKKRVEAEKSQAELEARAKPATLLQKDLFFGRGFGVTLIHLSPVFWFFSFAIALGVQSEIFDMKEYLGPSWTEQMPAAFGIFLGILVICGALAIKVGPLITAASGVALLIGFPAARKAARFGLSIIAVAWLCVGLHSALGLIGYGIVRRRFSENLSGVIWLLMIVLTVWAAILWLSFRRLEKLQSASVLPGLERRSS